MSEYRAGVVWNRTTEEFTAETYTRDHELSFGSGVSVPATSAPEYRGSTTRVNPEEGLVGAASSCHMLTFLAVCAKKKIIVDRYEDSAVGTLEKNDAGVLAVTKIALAPRVAFAAGFEVDRETLESLHHQAHRSCFIANSIKAEVTVNLG